MKPLAAIGEATRDGRLLVTALIAVAGCDDRVPLGSWEREPGGDGGAAGAVASGGAPSAGSPADAGAAGSTNGIVHACKATAVPGAFNPAGDEIGVTVPYTDWTWPAAVDSMEWEFQAESELQDDGYVWTHQFRFAGGARGFFGLQMRGGFQADPPFGPVVTADMAVFWMTSPSSPLRAVLGDVEYPDARTYLTSEAGEQWMTINARYPFRSCNTYRLRVGPVSTEANGSVWYGTWVLDTATEIETFIGRMLIPAAWGKLQPSSSMWSNRIGFAPMTTCADAEPATAFYGTPTGDGGSVRPTSFVNRFADPDRCPITRFTDFADGVRHEIGVRER